MIAAPRDTSSSDGEASDLASVWLDPSGQTVCLVGEVDLSNARTILGVVSRVIDSRPELILDLAGLEFLDCSGLHVIASLANRLQADDGKLVLKSPQRIVRRLIEISQLSEHPGLAIQYGADGASRPVPGSDYTRLA